MAIEQVRFSLSTCLAYLSALFMSTAIVQKSSTIPTIFETSCLISYFYRNCWFCSGSVSKKFRSSCLSFFGTVTSLSSCKYCAARCTFAEEICSQIAYSTRWHVTSKSCCDIFPQPVKKSHFYFLELPTVSIHHPNLSSILFTSPFSLSMSCSNHPHAISTSKGATVLSHARGP